MTGPRNQFLPAHQRDHLAGGVPLSPGRAAGRFFVRR